MNTHPDIQPSENLEIKSHSTFVPSSTSDLGNDQTSVVPIITLSSTTTEQQQQVQPFATIVPTFLPQPQQSVPTPSESISKIEKSVANGKEASPGISEEDGDFEPTAGMMIHDFDDERTMDDEEENYDDDSDDGLEELEDLNKESEMPIEELLASYGAGISQNTTPSTTGVSIFEKAINGMQETEIDENDDKRALRSAGNLTNLVSDSNSDDEDYDSSLNDDWKKKPRIGEDYQVHWIPNVESTVEMRSVNDLEVWNPQIVSSIEVENYLKEISEIHKQDSMFKLPMGMHTPDNEDALLLLKQCNNNTAEALRRYRSRPKPLLNELNVWSEEECLQFEIGLAIYGKDFHTIHQNKVKTKSVRDIVKFYYIWKKTERYDHFTAKTRLGKKKEPLHPGVTDYMERLLDENDQATLNYSNDHENHTEYPAAPHTNALREYIRNNYTSAEYPPTFPGQMSYEHLEMIDRENLQTNHTHESKTRQYLDIESSKSHNVHNNTTHSIMYRNNNSMSSNNAATKVDDKTDSERSTENQTSSTIS